MPLKNELRKVVTLHALIGGLIGAMLVAHGPAFVQAKGIIDKVVVPGLLSPLAGLVLGFFVMLALYWLFRAWPPGPLNRTFRGAQVFSAANVAFSHGANDSQKTVGVITLAQVAAGHLHQFVVPKWVIVASGLAIALGTYVGGWRIIFRLQPVNGFAAQTTAATDLLIASSKGLPVSTTHVVSRAVMGVGASQRLSAVRWGMAGNIVLAWVLTIPCAAMAGLVYGVPLPRRRPLTTGPNWLRRGSSPGSAGVQPTDEGRQDTGAPVTASSHDGP